MSYHFESVALTTHDQYIALLNKIEKQTHRIELVIPYGDGDDDELIAFLAHTCSEKKSSFLGWYDY